jgi:hypothetical protein
MCDNSIGLYDGYRIFIERPDKESDK